jgi:DNA-binding response OmpR family regulator
MPTALIVEDEPEANKLLAMLVQLRGFDTESALDGAQAIDHLRNHVPDVIFLDLMLPDVDGYDICRSLKSSGATRGIPVIIVTARITAENRMESFRAGADDFIPKPYMPDQIFEALEHAQSANAEIEATRVDGEAVLDARDEGETLRSLARLRNAVRARSGLEHETIEELVRALKAIWSNAVEWGNRRRLERVASLKYSLTDDSLTLTVTDEAGWLEGGRQLEGNSLAGLVPGGLFDLVVDDSTSRSIQLVKRFRPSS